MARFNKVGVLLGGPSAEREVSLKTGEAVVRALRSKGYDVRALDLGPDTAGEIRAQGVEVIYNALHGKWGEDGCVQGLLEVLRVPYTGPGVTASAVGMDKIISKRLFEADGLPVPPYQVLRRGEAAAADLGALGWPLVVKPATEGSSVGISIALDAGALQSALDAAFALDERVLVEKYVAGREFSVAVLDDDALGIVEIRPKPVPGEAVSFYDYQHKYTKGMTDYFTKPEGVDDAMVARLRGLAAAAARALGCEGVVRVDFILDAVRQPWLLEVNTLPGLTDLSLVPMIARDWRGIAFADLVEMVLNTARLKIGT